MLETIINTGSILWVLGIMTAVGVWAKVISHITVRKMVKAASEIQKSNHRLMRLVKAKFEHASMVSDKVQNVDAFVQKYLYEYKVLGARLETWRALQRKMIWYILAVGLLGVLGAYQVHGLGEQVFRYGSFTAIYAVFLYSIHILTNEKLKLQAAKNYMVDYLENVCIHRYEKANQIHAEVQAIEEVQQEEVALDIPAQVAEAVKQAEAEQEMKTEKERDEQQMRIRAILEEFLA